jgi:hypothetical protein
MAPCSNRETKNAVGLVYSWIYVVQVHRNGADSGALPEQFTDFHTDKPAAWKITSYRLFVVVC